MFLKNKRTGFVYVYSKALANDPEFEVYEEPKQEPVVPQQQQVVVKRKRANRNGNNLQPSHQ
jgi:hypothetical protein